MLGGMTQIGQNIQHASLVSEDGTRLFLHDVDGGMFALSGTVYARQFNPETRTPALFADSYRAKVTLANATLWALGLKVEQPGTVIAAQHSRLVNTRQLAQVF